MADRFIMRSNYAGQAFHFHLVVGFLSLMLIMQQRQHCAATQFIVGGAKGWSVPEDSNSNSFSQWAESRRFQIGDSLLFVYNSSQDSVLEVTKEDYANCTSTAPIATYTDGHSVYTFNHSGPFYFISGNKDHCLKNEKSVIIVLADRSNKTNQTTTVSSPSPIPTLSPPSLAPAPTSDESPPSELQPESPPPSVPPTGYQPTTPPETVPPPSPPQNAAPSVITSFFGSAGAVFASAFVYLI